MMVNKKIVAGSIFPDIVVPGLDGENIDLSQPAGPNDWRLVIVYRGKHCPICTRYLSELNAVLPDLKKLGIDAVAVSADPQEKAAAQLEEVQPDFPVGYGLTVAQMQ